MTLPFSRFGKLFLLLLTPALSCFNSRAATAPDVALTLSALDARKSEEFAAAKNLRAFHDFQFSNEIARSRITFEHHIVDDCGKNVKPIIYDHGCGLAAADVDGDGKIDIFFVNQIGGCELWRNLGDGTFENITASAGVAVAGKVCVGASFADLDNDGDPDLFVTTVKMGNVLFENLGGGKFRDVSKEAGVDHVGHSSGATFFDYDRDGLLDLFVANVGVYTTDQKGNGGYFLGVSDMVMGYSRPERNESSILYKNLGGLKFRRVSPEGKYVAWSSDASFCDLNEDGFPDLYVMNMSGPNSFYENQGGKGFIDKAEAYFPRTPNGAMGIKFFDFNQDGKMDLFVTDMHSDMSLEQSNASKKNFGSLFENIKSDEWCRAKLSPEDKNAVTNQLIFGNAFYLNQGNGKFTEVSDKIGAETFWPWGLSVGDLNADGYEDAFITAGMGYPFRYGMNSLLLNERGERFFSAQFLLNVEPRAGKQIDKEYFTLDCSGADKNNPLCYHKKGILSVRGVLSSRSSFMADLDGDGDLDLVVSEFNDKPQILISNLAGKRPIHYLKIKPRGTVSNRDGLGATIRVTAGGKTYTQYNNGKSGYLSQSTLPLYFGLGDSSRVDSIEVLWPSGIKQVLNSIGEINRQIEISEPAK